jgi:pimeloyl-ACP methyl ester carboxylesterase
LLTPEFTRLQYTAGSRQLEQVSPDAWILDQYFLNRPGNEAIQIELQYDYRNNPPLYPEWQAYMREYQPPTLVVWGKNDILFTTAGALAYERHLDDLELHLLNTGHFILDTLHLRKSAI